MSAGRNLQRTTSWMVEKLELQRLENFQLAPIKGKVYLEGVDKAGNFFGYIFSVKELPELC